MDESNLASDEKVVGVNGLQAQTPSQDVIMTKYGVCVAMELCFSSFFFVFFLNRRNSRRQSKTEAQECGQLRREKRQKKNKT